MNTDYEGRPVPEGEHLETVIKVWEVTPHIGNGRFDSFVQRSWQDMLEYVNDRLGYWLEQPEPSQLEGEGVTLTFRVIGMTRLEYDELADQED